jgi:hypothetical protein
MEPEFFWQNILTKNLRTCCSMFTPVRSSRGVRSRLVRFRIGPESGEHGFNSGLPVARKTIFNRCVNFRDARATATYATPDGLPSPDISALTCWFDVSHSLMA